MTAYRIGIVLCRVGAAVLTVQAIRSLGTTLPALVGGYGETDTQIWLLSLYSVVPGLVAIGLWVFADRIARIPDKGDVAQDADSFREIDFVGAGTALIGLTVAVLGLISEVRLEVLNWLQPDLDGGYRGVLDRQTAGMIASRVANIFQVLLGVGLVLGRKGVAAFLTTARFAGLARPERR